MNKLEYANNLLKKDDLSDYINQIEDDNLISPPADLKDKILKRCYNYSVDSKDNNVKKTKAKIKLIDVIKVACFSLIITLCTEIFMNATYASTKSNVKQNRTQKAIYKISDKLDDLSKEFSDYMLNFNLKGE